MVSFISGKPATQQIVLYLLQIRTLSQTTDDTVGKTEQAESLHILVSLEDQIKSSCNAICVKKKYHDPYHQMKMNKCCANVQIGVSLPNRERQKVIFLIKAIIHFRKTTIRFDVTFLLGAFFKS